MFSNLSFADFTVNAEEVCQCLQKKMKLSNIKAKGFIMCCQERQWDKFMKENDTDKISCTNGESFETC